MTSPSPTHAFGYQDSVITTVEARACEEWRSAIVCPACKVSDCDG